MVLVGNMHQLFNPDFCVLGGIFCYLLELDKKVRTDGDPQSLLAFIRSILMQRSHLARVCREWSKLLSNTQTLSLASLHLNAFGCRGNATEIFTRYTTVKRRVADTIIALQIGRFRDSVQHKKRSEIVEPSILQHMDCSYLA